jgi:predicted NBD/HSP70 family sugar kinase
LLNQSKRAVLQTLIEAGPMSRATLADRLGMSRAAISGLSRQLIEAGVLREAETAHDSSRLGRPSILLELDAGRGYFAGVSIEQDLCLMVLADLRGEILGQADLPFTADPETLAGRIGAALPGLLRACKLPRKRVLGLSVVLSGFVNHAQDTCLQSAILGWHNVPLAWMVEQLVGIPTSLENNARAAAMGEKLFGGGRGLRNFSVVTFGDGIGCGHYIDGQLYRGHGGGAGELAHCTIEMDGLPCRCGKRGCLDTIASRHAVLAAARDQGLAATSLRDVEAAAAGGDVVAIRILHRAGSALGLAISHLIQINNPERVVIAAVEDSLGSLFRTVTRQTIDATVLPQLAALTDLRFDEVNENFRARSAASIAAHRFLVDSAH